MLITVKFLIDNECIKLSYEVCIEETTNIFLSQAYQ